MTDATVFLAGLSKENPHDFASNDISVQCLFVPTNVKNETDANYRKHLACHFQLRKERLLEERLKLSFFMQLLQFVESTSEPQRRPLLEEKHLNGSQLKNFAILNMAKFFN